MYSREVAELICKCFHTTLSREPTIGGGKLSLSEEQAFRGGSATTIKMDIRTTFPFGLH